MHLHVVTAQNDNDAAPPFVSYFITVQIKDCRLLENIRDVSSDKWGYFDCLKKSKETPLFETFFVQFTRARFETKS